MRLVVICLLAVPMVGCGPEYPNDENHRGATDPDCAACHFYLETDLTPREPPESHWDGNGPDDHYDSCTVCHDMS